MHAKTYDGIHVCVSVCVLRRPMSGASTTASEGGGCFKALSSLTSSPDFSNPEREGSFSTPPFLLLPPLSLWCASSVYLILLSSFSSLCQQGLGMETLSGEVKKETEVGSFLPPSMLLSLLIKYFRS